MHDRALPLRRAFHFRRRTRPPECIAATPWNILRRRGRGRIDRISAEEKARDDREYGGFSSASRQPDGTWLAICDCASVRLAAGSAKRKLTSFRGGGGEVRIPNHLRSRRRKLFGTDSGAFRKVTAESFARQNARRSLAAGRSISPRDSPSPASDAISRRTWRRAWRSRARPDGSAGNRRSMRDLKVRPMDGVRRKKNLMSRLRTGANL